MSENQNPQPTLNIRRVFLKDTSLEMPSGANIFKEEWSPQVNMDIGVGSTALDEENYEVTLTLTVKVETNEKTAFLIEVHQAGIFAISGLEQKDLAHALGAFCPNILFPYAREVVDNLAAKASFPPLLLSPINFDDLLFEQNRQKASAEAQTH